MVRRSLLLLCLSAALACSDATQEDTLPADAAVDGASPDSGSSSNATCSVQESQCVSSTGDPCCTLNGHRVEVDEDAGCKRSLDEAWSRVMCAPPPCNRGAMVTCYEVDDAGESVTYLSNYEVFGAGASALTKCLDVSGAELLAMPECPN
ncbi:MAG: hypothetical protein ACOC1F_06080 [Myxococcota bacterium]